MARFLRYVGSFVLDAVASLIILLAAMTAATGAAFVAHVVWTELTTDPKIWEPLGVVCGTVGGLVATSAAVVWAWARLNRETP